MFGHYVTQNSIALLMSLKTLPTGNEKVAKWLNDKMIVGGRQRRAIQTKTTRGDKVELRMS
jgi:hypothetical protein